MLFLSNPFRAHLSDGPADHVFSSLVMAGNRGERGLEYCA